MRLAAVVRLLGLCYNSAKWPGREGAATGRFVTFGNHGQGQSTMAMIRPLHPADVPSYLAFSRSACYGQRDHCWEGASSPQQLIRSLARTLAINTPHHNTWVYTHERSIQGLVTVRSRHGSAVWEVERLCQQH